MRVLNIIVEGPTEREFVNGCIAPFFHEHGLYNIRTIGIETSPGHKGGDVRYARFEPNVRTLLRGKEDMIVTSLIDFYELRSDFPKYQNSLAFKDVQQRVEFLENACYEDIGDERFVPYIQLHEFEGLLFTKMDGFKFLDIPSTNRKLLQNIINDHPNPETINNGPQTAPSKRLLHLIPNYQKTFHGPFIALENGFDSIMEKCPRFYSWINKLLERMKA
ncbi:DUF4276 family protein [Pontibacter ramchanderi]|uniref:Uncharacterized protein DUF4276 n=1 Tax=Pontibacter ramchanderi TaxID=1179743 RepID=A0A2N3V2P4_9BACT|nr:DUF4276 family protein [Pontibacter ramchanderi]PKV75897.1 uncharacterized protein DUF4276 [Pontibacter ramchanderi]